MLLGAARRARGDQMRCKFKLSEIDRWADKYGNPAEDAEAERVSRTARARGYLGRNELVTLAGWKSTRIKHHAAANDEAFVRDVTGLALSTSNERLRIESLTLLRGVGWPMGSVILHFCHSDRYPILDFRALWSLGEGVPHRGYDFSFWHRYVETCRKLAGRGGVDMRTLDRALWGYSKVKQQ